MSRRPASRIAVALLGGLLLAAASLMPLSGAPQTAAAGDPALTMERLGGADRYAAAATISRRFFSPGVAAAFIVSGLDFADGLATGPAAAKLGAPVLYVAPTWVPSATLSELRRLTPRKIVMVGGPASVSESVRQQLAPLAADGITRIGGADRYAVAAAIGRTYFADAPVVYVATGQTFPDGLAAGSAAAVRGGLVLLVRQDAVPAEIAAELKRLHPAQIVIAGGTGSVSSAVETRLRSYSPSVVRAGGIDRYAAAVSISQTAFAPRTQAAVLTTGLTFPDALVGISPAAQQRAPILLVRTTSIPPVVSTELVRLRPGSIFLLGGSGSVATAVAKAAQHLLGICWTGNKPSAGSAQYISSIPTAAGQMALTFDMGGRLDPAVSILNYLIDNQVCATIFPTGSASQTDVGRRVLALIAAHPELFEVGNHTMHHCDLVTGQQSAGSPYCPTSRPSSAFITKELGDAAAIIGAGTGQDPRPYWRAPFGASDAASRAAAAAVGYTKTFQWNIDTIDWSTATTKDLIVSRVLNKASSGSIVLMHLGGYTTLDALPSLVSALRSRGYTLTSLSDMLD